MVVEKSPLKQQTVNIIPLTVLNRIFQRFYNVCRNCL